MKTIKVIDEDFSNYEYPAMFIAMPFCSFKCDIESGIKCCQNSGLANAEIKDLDVNILILSYIENPITSAVVFGGLEPFDSFDDVYEFIYNLRNKYHNNDVCVIYTGYNKFEIEDKIEKLKPLGNIICKFGRFIPGNKKRYDELLSVDLASDNQYAEQIC